MDLYLDPQWRRIGIRLSGGADSSLLYYALMHDTKLEVVPMTMDTKLKDWYQTGTARVIDRVTELTGRKPYAWYQHYQPDFVDIFKPEPYVTGVDQMQADCVKKYDLDAVYIGLTRNPPIDQLRSYFETHNHGLNIEDVFDHQSSRDAERDSQVEPVIMNLSNTVQVIPWANDDKHAVYQAYLEYNVLETLYPYTYSCESTGQNFVHCEHCFFCQERWWAFGRII
jgi:hypothetical protein